MKISDQENALALKKFYSSGKNLKIGRIKNYSRYIIKSKNKKKSDNHIYVKNN